MGGWEILIVPKWGNVASRSLKHSTILVAGKKKEETEEQNAYIQCNYIKSKEFIIQETASDVVTEPRVGPGWWQAWKFKAALRKLEPAGWKKCITYGVIILRHPSRWKLADLNALTYIRILVQGKFGTTVPNAKRIVVWSCGWKLQCVTLLQQGFSSFFFLLPRIVSCSQCWVFCQGLL